MCPLVGGVGAVPAAPRARPPTCPLPRALRGLCHGSRPGDATSSFQETNKGASSWEGLTAGVQAGRKVRREGQLPTLHRPPPPRFMARSCCGHRSSVTTLPPPASSRNQPELQAPRHPGAWGREARQEPRLLLIPRDAKWAAVTLSSPQDGGSRRGSASGRQSPPAPLSTARPLAQQVVPSGHPRCGP